MTYETIIGPLSRVICCLVPIAWLPALLIFYAVRNRKNTGQPDKK